MASKAQKKPRAEHQRWRKDHQKKIRKLKERSMLLSINKMSAARTLRKSARNHIRKENEKWNAKIPWVQELNWRYKPNAYPRAHLLSLPTEIRQQILTYTITKVEMKEMTMMQLRKWVGTLSVLSPVIRMELPYLANIWYEEKARYMKLLPRSDPERVELAKYRIALSQKKKGEEIKVKGKKERKNRPAKCWFCMGRHYGKDPMCLHERQHLTEWLRATKPLSKQKRNKIGLGGVQKMQGFAGKKTVFGDDGAVEWEAEM
ncbi:hypothetical protein BDV96DRAFT_577538 [Lophiotrema nucula]|uniref:Uncharacterized protein n=1 Tax=Lophiotrema nucula TaxID=690887 RepID=A0A6A5Z3U3_9PLEO|nr:hypothetical protein BDV96DRAFT_577538 [Lophiotrema nucula]